MKKIGFCIFLSFILVINSIMPCFAAATASNAQLNIVGESDTDEWIGDDGELVASSSDADLDARIEELMSYSVMALGDDYSIALASSDEQEYTSVYAMDNTVSPNGVSVSAYYYNTDGKLVQGPEVSAYQTAGSTGYLRMLLNQASLKIPDDFAYMSHYAIKLSSISFPDPGVYEMCFGIAVSELSDLTCSMELGTRKYIGNAKYQDSHDELEVYSTSGGMFCYPTTVDIGNISYMELRVYPTNWKTYYFPTRLVMSFVFEKQSSDTAADITTAGGSYSSADAATDTAQNTSQIVQNTSEMNDTLKEIVQTISNQLEALWDQMYNLMHLPQLANDDKNTDRIIDKLGEDLNVEIQNQDDNTETIVNGYDGSGMDADNNRLDSSITEYEEAEKSVLDSVNENLTDFEFSDSFDSYLSSISVISGFIQDMYDSSGALKDVINIGFFLSIAGIVIGLYRFKEG